jgi:hypothetical protein
MFSCNVVYFLFRLSSVYKMTMHILWDVMACQLVASSNEIVGNYYHSTWCNIPEDLSLHRHTSEIQFHAGCDMFVQHGLLFNAVGTAFMYFECALLARQTALK